MPVIVVTRQELEEAGLSYLLHQKTQHRTDLEVYYWAASEPQATLCLLAGIGRILADDSIDLTG